VTPDSPFDRYLKGDKRAMTPLALKGMKRVEKVGCLSCHSGPNFSGPALPQGQALYQKFPMVSGTDYEKTYRLSEDLGRYEVTKKDEDKNKWKVPTWRNVALTAPYFHNGSVRTLSEAVRVMGKTQLSQDLSDSDVGEIVAFLESLTGEFPKQALPRLPHTSGVSLIDQ
jgi:cytochrome c peroxidase